MRQRTIIVWTGSLAALVLSILSGLVLTDHTAVFRISMIFSVAAALLTVFAIPFFLNSLKRFKVELRQTYVILCIGIGIFGLAQVQLPLVNLYNTGFWVDSGVVAIPYLVGVIGIFWGMKSLSRLLAIKTVWSSGWLALLVTTAISLAVSFLPHVNVVIDELSYDIALMLSIWNSVFITFAAILAYIVRKKIGLLYADSVSWLYRALVILSFAGWHYAITQLLFTVNDWYYDYSIAIIPFVAGGLALVIAGFSFDSIDSARDKSPAILPVPAIVTADVPIVLSPTQELEVVSYVTNLVSNPDDIDTALNEVHRIASSVLPGQSPSVEDQKKLDAIYSKLEEYLLYRDPLRVFTQEELRERISKRFGFGTTVKTNLWHPKR